MAYFIPGFLHNISSSTRQNVHISDSLYKPSRSILPAVCSNDTSEPSSRKPVLKDRLTPASIHEVATSVQSISSGVFNRDLILSQCRFPVCGSQRGGHMLTGFSPE